MAATEPRMPAMSSVRVEMMLDAEDVAAADEEVEDVLIDDEEDVEDVLTDEEEEEVLIEEVEVEDDLTEDEDEVDLAAAGKRLSISSICSLDSPPMPGKAETAPRRATRVMATDFIVSGCD